MEPRKKDSKKWTSLPPDFSAQIKSVFEENFKENLKNKSLKVEGRIYPTEIMLRINMSEKGRLKHENFEVSLDHSAAKQDTIPKIHLAVDALASLLMDYFEKSADEDTEVDVPYTWKPMDFEKVPMWFQFTTENPDLEAEANKLLGIDEEGIVRGEDGESDSDFAQDEDVDLSTPQMFGGGASSGRGKNKKEDMH